MNRLVLCTIEQESGIQQPARVGYYNKELSAEVENMTLSTHPRRDVGFLTYGMHMRKKLKRRDEERFRVRATVARFGTSFSGGAPTVLLLNISDCATGDVLTDHMWFRTGRWSASFRIGDVVCFDARVSRYAKGRHFDWRMMRPTKVVREPTERRELLG